MSDAFATSVFGGGSFGGFYGATSTRVQREAKKTADWIVRHAMDEGTEASEHDKDGNVDIDWDEVGNIAANYIDNIEDKEIPSSISRSRFVDLVAKKVGTMLAKNKRR